MSRAGESSEAEIGYKLKVGDYVMLSLPDSKLTKSYRVVKTTRETAIASMGSSRPRYIRFPRYYYQPFKPLITKRNKDYESPNKWTVRVNDVGIKRRLGVK